ncbi:integrase [Crossiella equi]|uniref:Integrase n=1 Tax=Crossiella equi TaxID=130796 RepID=A0ABS5ALY3_9PSEU|nr:site-specific integrase [Crossiella equi]MBP2477574.1 integrase [Crossiella equi]
MARRAREDGEGSIFPYRNGFAAYVWVETQTGEKKRKYVYGKSREEVHDKWIKLHAEAAKGPVSTTATERIGQHLWKWHENVVTLNSAPLTAKTYETFLRLYIIPGLGAESFARLTVAKAQAWMNKLARTCQCCAQGKDAARKPDKQKCCAVGKCCGGYLSRRSLFDIRACARAGINYAIVEDKCQRNPVTLIKIPKVEGRMRVKKTRRWSTADLLAFLVSAKEDDDPMYAAYVLVLVNALRKGEALGLPLDSVDLARKELDICYQLQRVDGKLLHRETKTPASDDTMPLVDLAERALRGRLRQRELDRQAADVAWQECGLVFTTRLGTPIEPRNFYRSWVRRCEKAGVPVISVHGARRLCASLLAELGVHPRVAMRILRHANLKTTMEIYTDVSEEQTREALEKLSDLLGA